jgi:hypothetical protein
MLRPTLRLAGGWRESEIAAAAQARRSGLTNSAQASPSAGTATGGFFRDWVLPIGLGLVLGLGIWVAWPHVWPPVRGFFKSKVANIVEKWRDDDPESHEKLAKELRDLGPGVRDELLAAMRGLPSDSIEAKMWVATLAAGEPWFATTSLKEICGNDREDEEDRRAAACGLLDFQNREVDTEVVLPVLDAWLKDVKSDDRAIAVHRAQTMWRSGMLSGQWEERIRKDLVAIARKEGLADADDVERDADARAGALLTLGLASTNPEVKQLLWSTAKDENDDELARVNSLRAIAEGKSAEPAAIDDWAALGKSSNEVMRQAVADNLGTGMTMDEAFDRVLVPLQYDANPLARAAAIDAQATRRRPTMFERFDELAEDSDSWVRFSALLACGKFKHETTDLPRRVAIVTRALEKSDDRVEVMGAAVAMLMLTDQVYGFRPGEVHVHEQDVDETALATFMSDKAGRVQAAEKWRGHFPGATWTDAERAATLEKLLQHADPKNRERAKFELELMKKQPGK